MRATMPSTKAGSKPARRAVGSQKPSILGNPPMTARLGQPSLISRSRIFLRCSRDGCMPEIVLEKRGRREEGRGGRWEVGSWRLENKRQHTDFTDCDEFRTWQYSRVQSVRCSLAVPHHTARHRVW